LCQRRHGWSPRTATGRADSPEAKLLRTAAGFSVYNIVTAARSSVYNIVTAAASGVYNIVHLIYGAKKYEGHSKDYEFSQRCMEEHWRAGYHAASCSATLRQMHTNELNENPTSIAWDAERNSEMD